MKKSALTMASLLLLTLLLSALLILPASAATVTETIYSSDTSSEAYKDFALPSNAGNIQVSVNTGSVLYHGRNANGTYRVRVGGGSVTAAQALTKDIDAEHVNTRTQTYNSSGVLISTAYSWGNSDNHPTVPYNVNGYTGTLTKWLFTQAPGNTYMDGSNKCVETIYTGYYKGQVTKQATVYSYTVTITHDTSGGNPTVPTPPPEVPPTPVSSETYTVETNEMIYVPVRAVNISSFTGRTFTVTYPVSKLTLIDAAYYTADGAAITVTSHNTTTGVITFTCAKAITANQTWTGVVVIMAFKAIANGDAAVSVGMS